MPDDDSHLVKLSGQVISDQSVTVQDLKYLADETWNRYFSHRKQCAKELSIALVLEAAELLEHFRFRSDFEAEALMNCHDSRSRILDEIADILLLVMWLAQRYNIDLSTAAWGKVNALTTRPRERW